MRKISLFSIVLIALLSLSRVQAASFSLASLADVKLLERSQESFAVTYYVAQVNATSEDPKTPLPELADDEDEALHCKVVVTEGEKKVKFTCWFCDCAAFAEAMSDKPKSESSSGGSSASQQSLNKKR